jgi:hypothetical protein
MTPRSTPDTELGAKDTPDGTPAVPEQRDGGAAVAATP